MYICTLCIVYLCIDMSIKSVGRLKTNKCNTAQLVENRKLSVVSFFFVFFFLSSSFFLNCVCMCPLKVQIYLHEQHNRTFNIVF